LKADVKSETYSKCSKFQESNGIVAFDTYEGRNIL